MANNDDQEQTYDARLVKHKQYFADHYGCSISPSFYFISFDNGYAHWSTMPWGWSLSSLNLKDGDSTQCGKGIYSGIAICKKCYADRGDEIRKKCQEFNKEIKENHQEVIDNIKQKGLKIGIITYT
ncbi:hypothetical protein I4U23_004148 [Adineta vaga]|nr:hypothetical protein I4U23_004148 [Adineta vaga]